MKATKMSDIQNIDSKMQEKEIQTTKKKMFDLKISLKLKKETKSHYFKVEKRKLAQLLTLKHNHLIKNN